MSTNLFLLYAHPENLDSTVPIERQWESSKLTDDGHFSIRYFHHVFKEVELTGPDGTVGQWIDVKSIEIKETLIEGLRMVSRALMETDDQQAVWGLIRLNDLLIEALDLHLKGNLITIRWS